MSVRLPLCASVPRSAHAHTHPQPAACGLPRGLPLVRSQQRGGSGLGELSEEAEEVEPVELTVAPISGLRAGAHEA